MDLFLLDENFSVIGGPLDKFTSVIIRERYYEDGTFELHMPTSAAKEIQSSVSGGASRYLRSSVADRVLTRSGSARQFCGLIEYIATDGDTAQISGRILTCLAARRIMSGHGSYTGAVTDVVTEAVGDFLTECSVSSSQARIEDVVTLDYSYDSLGERLYSLLQEYGASFDIRLDETTGSPVFSVVRGRSTGAVFSVSFGNIADCETEWDGSETVGTVYAYGKDGTVVVCGDGAPEVRVKFDITLSDFDTAEEYEAALEKRGDEYIARHRAQVSVEADMVPGTLPVYGADIYIGDTGYAEDRERFGTLPVRIVSADIAEERGTRRVIPHFSALNNTGG